LGAKPKPSKVWPEQVQTYWSQAKDNLQRENWEAAITLSRTALQSVARQRGARGGNLRAEIDNLGEQEILSPNMVEWAHAVI
jgi:hypothetical protein